MIEACKYLKFQITIDTHQFLKFIYAVSDSVGVLKLGDSGFVNVKVICYKLVQGIRKRAVSVG